MTELSDLQPLGPYAPAGCVIVARPERLAAEYHSPTCPPYPRAGRRHVWRGGAWDLARDWRYREGVRA
jgi:hypothetical protein